jgi:5-methylthioadenosine/S-adenosylhomocysteine deaminase
MIVRPDAVVLPNGIQTGLEVCFSEGKIAEIRPWTTELRDEAGYVLSPKFVNAHSHFEYYDLIGAIEGSGYWDWIRELTHRKAERDPSFVEKVCQKAARLNVQTGVWAVAEWSDWEGSDDAMQEYDLDGCIFQELITFKEWESPDEKYETVRARSLRNKIRTHIAPHSPYTVAPKVISDVAATSGPISIHVSETQGENDFYLHGTGPIAEGYAAAGISVDAAGATAVGYLDRLGALGPNTQLVHVCAATYDDLELIAERGCSVAHCPRSNTALGCPTPEVGRLLDLGVRVGIGMDSAASSGCIDMFAEMREAKLLSSGADRRLGAKEVWDMALSTGCMPWLPRNEIDVGGAPKLMLVHSRPDYDSLIHASPRDVHSLEAFAATTL